MDTRGEIMDCHALPCKARNDRKRGFFKQDSRACCGALGDSKNLWVGVTFGGNDCPQIFRNARMLTQDRIY